MKDADGHRCDKYREVQSERADQKQHDERGFQVGSLPDIAKAVGEVSARSKTRILQMKFTYAKEAQRAEQGSKRDRADQEYPPGARESDEHARNSWANHPPCVERGGIQGHCIRQIGLPDQFQ